MKHKLRDIAVFTRRLSDLLEGGLPLSRCLSTLAEQTEKAGLRAAVNRLHDNIRNGKSLSQALSEAEGEFPPVMVEMIKVGESSGSLEPILRHLSEFLESEIETKRKLRDAMTYPVLLTGLAVLVSVFVVGFVIPRFEALFSEIGAELPLPTRLLIAFASWIHNPSVPLFAAGLLMAGLPMVEKRLASLPSRLPQLRKWIHVFFLHRWFHVMEILLKSGFPLHEAIQLSRNAAATSWFAGHLVALQQKVYEGQSLAGAMSSSPAFPSYICEMIATGEETAGLETVFERLFRSYQRESRLALQRFLSLLEPALIIVMGGLVGFVALAMLLPIFEMSAGLR